MSFVGFAHLENLSWNHVYLTIFWNDYKWTTRACSSLIVLYKILLWFGNFLQSWRQLYHSFHVPFYCQCYISITMSTWSPSPIITTIITLIQDANSCLSPLSSLGHFPKLLPSHSWGHTTLSSSYSRFILLWAHYHWHILCQRYSVIISGYHLGLFTQQLDLQFVFQGMGMHGMTFYICHIFIPCLRFYL